MPGWNDEAILKPNRIIVDQHRLHVNRGRLIDPNLVRVDYHQAFHTGKREATVGQVRTRGVTAVAHLRRLHSVG